MKLFRYLGHYIAEFLKDRADIERERRALVARRSKLARRFARCSNEAKIIQSLLPKVLTCALWTWYPRKVLDILHVRYNNKHGVLLGLLRYYNASGTFTDAGTNEIHAMMTKKRKKERNSRAHAWELACWCGEPHIFSLKIQHGRSLM